MSDRWRVKSDSWISPLHVLFYNPYPPKRYWVENTTTGEWKVLEVEDGQDVGDAIANGQFVGGDDGDEPAEQFQNTSDHDDGYRDVDDDKDSYDSSDSAYSSTPDYSYDPVQHANDATQTPLPKPPKPDLRYVQLVALATLSPAEFEAECQRRIRSEVERYAVPLVTTEEVWHFSFLNGEPLPVVLAMAETYRADPSYGNLWYLARVIIDARYQADPLVREAVDGLLADRRFSRYNLDFGKGDNWSLVEYVRELRRSRQEREEAEAESRRQQAKEEARLRAATPWRQLMRLFLVVLGTAVIGVLVWCPAKVGRIIRAKVGQHWTLKWLPAFENFLEDARVNLPWSRLERYIRDGE